VIGNINARQTQLTRTANEVATGKRILLPGDDPAGAVQASIIQRTIEQQESYLSNIKQGSNSLSYADSILSGFSDAIDTAKSVALSSADTTRSPADYEAAAEQIDTIINQLVSQANGKFMGQFAFGGNNPTVQPFSFDGNYVSYSGDNSWLQSLQGDAQKFIKSVTADGSIGAFSSVGYGANLNPDINGATRLRDLNGGAGVDLGEIQISTGTGSPVVVDLSAAESVQDVLDIINNNSTLSGQGFSVGLNSSGNGIAIAAGPNATASISNFGGSSTATDLGIVFSGANIPADGTTLTPRITATTPVSLLNNGNGIDATQSLIIQNGSDTVAIDLSSAVTVEDVINKINSAGIGVRAEINAGQTGINVLNNRSGSSFAIVENSQTGAIATSLGIATSNLGTSLSDIDNGAGVPTIEGADITIGVADGSSFQIDLSTANTFGDVQQLIQTATGGKVSVSINPQGGLKLVDNTTGSANFAVADLNGSKTATNLGIVSSTTGGGTILGTNVMTGRVQSVFDTLIRLRDALRDRDQTGIQWAGNALDTDQAKLAFARGAIGARLNALDALSTNITNNVTSLTKQNSDIVDADFTETTMQLNIQQTALQAALAASSKLLQQSLLDYL
jgi:flagellin-like hook-associated protein FlgL